MGPAMGPGGTSQPGAAVIWGLALNFKVGGFSFIGMSSHGGGGGGRLVPIKLQRPPERVGREA